MTEARLPTDTQLWRCMSETMRSVVLPRLEDPWARVALIRLIGLAEYAPVRGEDPTPGRVGELVACIERLADRHPELREHLPSAWPARDPVEVLDLCGQLLAGAIGQTTAAAESIRAELRPMLVAQLDDDLSGTAPLIAAFGGQLSDA